MGGSYAYIINADFTQDELDVYELVAPLIYVIVSPVLNTVIMHDEGLPIYGSEIMLDEDNDILQFMKSVCTEDL
ncbi:hypothetical protein [Paenibacillus agricola]|uniref:Uncharacterized protein n=1 Tax=Paenibacillus agricola TaxID=2716264 RepID=A0ABX0JHG2_9BACL|nr:hypothetical protein [Paenibacillus agricola]NHN33150.1 hypothetical protein [Paenibacillus agricola]